MEIFFNDILCSGLVSYERFAKLQQDIISANDKNIILRLNIENRTGLTFVLCLSLLPFLAKNKGINLEITVNNKLLNLMYKTDVIDKISLDSQYDLNISQLLINKARIIKSQDDIFKLVTEITKEAPVKMNDKLTAIFTSRIGEMYINSIEHAQTEYIIGSKYYKYQKNLYCFSCYDTGIGIPQNVISYFFNTHKTIISQKQALEWAFRSGNSTANKFNTVPRGLGMQLLKNFARLNGGAIRIWSNNILYMYKNGSEEYFELKNEFIGTLFEMDIVADNERAYSIR